MAHPLYQYRQVQHGPCGFVDADKLETRERTEVGEDGFTARELRFVYECMCDPVAFKGPFITAIAPNLLKVAQSAVRYFTNTSLEVIGVDHQTGRLIVRSHGQ